MAEEGQEVSSDHGEVTDDGFFEIGQDSPFGKEELGEKAGEHEESAEPLVSGDAGEILSNSEEGVGANEEPVSLEDAANEVTEEAKVSESELEAMIREDYGPKDEPTEAEKELEKPDRANRRIRSLVTRAKQAEQQTQQYQQQFQQYAAQQQQQMQEMQLHNARLEERLKYGMQQATVDPDDPTTALKKEMGLDNLDERIQSVADQKVAALQQRLDQMQTETTQREKQAQMQQTSETYKREIDQTVDEVLMKGADPAKIDRLRGPMRLMLMAASYGATASNARNSDVKSVATQLRRLMMEGAGALTSGRALSRKQQLTKNESVGPNVNAAPKGRRSVSKGGAGEPSQAELEKRGFDNHLDYMLKGGR